MYTTLYDICLLLAVNWKYIFRYVLLCYVYLKIVMPG